VHTHGWIFTEELKMTMITMKHINMVLRPTMTTDAIMQLSRYLLEKFRVAIIVVNMAPCDSTHTHTHTHTHRHHFSGQAHLASPYDLPYTMTKRSTVGSPGCLTGEGGISDTPSKSSITALQVLIARRGGRDRALTPSPLPISLPNLPIH